MDAHQRSLNAVECSALSGKLSKTKSQKHDSQSQPSLYLTNAVFFGLFFSVAYFLLHRWREKIRTSTPLHVLTISEIVAVVSLIASFFYLMAFFGIGFILHPFAASRAIQYDEEDEAEIDKTTGSCLVGFAPKLPLLPPKTAVKKVAPASVTLQLSSDDEEVVQAVVSGSIPSYSLESKLGDCRRAAAIRNQAVERVTGKSLEGLPIENFDYDSILGQCCEMPIGFVQIPVGVAGPLLLDGKEFTVPMATTEGCLVASTNRGCKAIYVSGGASAVVLRDGMTRAPVVRFI
ncbi:3-hydroxy-3-methylglutaryl-coenzyme A reductase 1-like [Vicia villosa]|uniref:3-hydroxy-3-methylglutaryl-coenzyme A reductase 1-like n=1 Tax=Vicia villosa TaxID=3911 RepID=UPI00273B7E29|nr:3-hydroxy-3-methylglutaryl-coenzyme A reductase 1-like [Vicia villosa]